METVRIPNGETEKIVITLVNSSGNTLTGKTVSVTIWRESDSKWYTGAAWQSGYASFDATEFAQGDYYYNFNTTGLGDDTYHVRGKCASSDVANPLNTGELKVGYFIDTLASNLDVAVSTRSTLTSANVGDAVWNEVTGDHITSGTFGQKVNDVLASIWDVGTRTVTDIGSSGIASQASLDNNIQNTLWAKRLQKNRYKIDETVYRAFLYKDDDVTVLASWDLKDSSGTAASRDIFERIPR